MTNIDQPTAEEINNTFKSAGDSVELINGIIDGSKMINEDPQDKEDTVKRNVEHLELIVAKDYWTNQNMTAVKKAIVDGKAYLA
jgi:hypothetical protein